jgi:hypothetical protein
MRLSRGPHPFPGSRRIVHHDIGQIITFQTEHLQTRFGAPPSDQEIPDAVSDDSRIGEKESGIKPAVHLGNGFCPKTVFLRRRHTVRASWSCESSERLKLCVRMFKRENDGIPRYRFECFMPGVCLLPSAVPQIKWNSANPI